LPYFVDCCVCVDLAGLTWGGGIHPPTNSHLSFVTRAHAVRITTHTYHPCLPLHPPMIQLKHTFGLFGNNLENKLPPAARSFLFHSKIAMAFVASNIAPCFPSAHHKNHPPCQWLIVIYIIWVLLCTVGQGGGDRGRVSRGSIFLFQRTLYVFASCADYEAMAVSMRLEDK